MEYTVSGIIRFYPTAKLKLDTTVDVSSPSGARIALNSTDDSDLAIVVILEAKTDTAAKEAAEIELRRICDLLSYFHDIPILESRITGMVSAVVTPEGKYITVTEEIRLKDTVSVIQGLGPESTGKLVSYLENEYSPSFEDVISMWREAISTEASALKYLLLYRLMEFLFRSDTKTLTDWIKRKEPNVQLLSDRQRGEITVYTYLRDNIHPKQKGFPAEQIGNFLPRLQDLSKRAIKEKFSQA